MLHDDSKVLIVDDDPLVSAYIKRLVESVGLPARTFATAEEFLEQGLPGVPCCVVLDVRMPGLSGTELHALMLEKGMEAPVIFITAHASVEMGVESIKSGALDFIEKPFDDQRLIDAVQKALRKARSDLEKRTEAEEAAMLFDTLTEREKEVFFLVAEGLPNKLIADRLDISEKTVKIHRGRVMQKTGAGSLADLVRLSEKIVSLETAD